MATNVVMPQMGESIAEGTIVRWIKKVGDNGRSRRAAVRDLDRQGRRRDPVAGGRRPDRDQGQGRGDGPRQHRRRGHRRGGREPRGCGRAPADGADAGAAASAMPAAAVGQPETAAAVEGHEPVDGRSAAAEARPSDAAAPAAAGRSALERGAAAPEVVAARPPDRARAQRRHPADPGHRHQRARDEAATSSATSRPGGRSARRAAAPGARRSAAGSDTGPRLKPGEKVADRPDERDAQEDRRAHGAQRAHVAARVLGLRGELRPGDRSCATSRRRRTSAAGAKLTFTAFIAKAIVDALRAVPDRQRVDRRRQHRLQEGHQSRDRGGARQRPDRAGHQATRTRRTCSV